MYKTAQNRTIVMLQLTTVRHFDETRTKSR